MLSGIRPAAELEKYSNPFVLDAPAVGQNLFDHPAFFSFDKLKDAGKGYARPFAGTSKPEYGQGSAIDFTLFAEMSPMLSSERSHFQSLTCYDGRFAPPPLFPTIEEDNAHICFAAIHMLPLSRGTVSLRSADPKDDPVCDPNFFSTETDRFIMRRAVRENLKIVSTPPFADHVEGEVPPLGFPALTTQSSDDEIDARIRAMTMTVAHPMGTCALGQVLDEEFRVKGVQSLRVCDASIFPEPVAAMPSCLIYAMAEMAAEMVAGKDT
ncbi:hypothetical protein E8E13_010069 [Curvularia kusanoi]|uniref:Glucose-methanol-choline oxidoreductase C-terminal domain-containing protein n=1 Tax=Curvularia kusanoi TaxID=90978 RepID=A0A9P4TEQ2_CURKU|nr:hypothetical protein E8E13_010069 [Curvularia kusanoi]